MIIYNVTVNVDNSIHDEWLEWMKSNHIPKVLSTGKFKKAVFSRVLVEDDGESKTYSARYFSNSRVDLDSYYQNDAESLRNEALTKFADKLLAFRTELDVVDEYKVDITNS